MSFFSDADAVARSIAAINETLPMLSPEEDEALMYEAGFSFKGWVGYRP